jgi:hypothetical protein
VYFELQQNCKNWSKKMEQITLARFYGRIFWSVLKFVHFGAGQKKREGILLVNVVIYFTQVS